MQHIRRTPELARHTIPYQPKPFSELLEQQAQIAIVPTHANQPYAQRELVPLTTAAEELLALPGTDRILRATLGQLDGHAGAAELRGMSFTTGAASHQRAVMLSNIESGAVPQPTTSEELGALIAEFNKPGSQTRGHARGLWIDFAGEQTANLRAIAAAPDVMDATQAVRYRRFLQVATHELSHAEQPMRNQLGPRFGMLEEGTADTLASWPGMQDRLMRAGGFPALPPDTRDASALQASESHQSANAMVREVLRMVDIDPDDAAQLDRARALLRGQPVTELPAALSAELVRTRGMTAADADRAVGYLTDASLANPYLRLRAMREVVDPDGAMQLRSLADAPADLFPDGGRRRAILEHIRATPELANYPVDGSTLGELVERQAQFAIVAATAGQPLAERTIVPLTRGATQLLEEPGTEQLLRATLGPIDGQGGATQIRGISIMPTRHSMTDPEHMHYAQLIGDAEAGLAEFPKDVLALERLLPSYKGMAIDGRGMRHWIDIAGQPARSFRELAAEPGMAAARAIPLRDAFLHVALHEGMHSARPIPVEQLRHWIGESGQSVNMLEEGAAEVLSMWPDLQARVSRAAGLPDDAVDAAITTRGLAYPEEHALVAQMLRWVDLDPNDAAGYDRAFELLRGQNVVDLPERFAAELVKTRGMSTSEAGAVAAAISDPAVMSPAERLANARALMPSS